MECLLSFIEFTQYQQYLINENYDRFQDRKNRAVLNRIYLIALPSNIPLSALVEDRSDDNKENPNHLNRLSHEQRERIYSLNSVPAMSITSPKSVSLQPIPTNTNDNDHDHPMPISSNLSIANNHSVPTTDGENDRKTDDEDYGVMEVVNEIGMRQMETIPIPMDSYREESPSAASRSTNPTDNEDDAEDDINDDNDDLFKYKLKAHQIYEKYIKTNSEFEINISSECRTTVSDILDDAYQLLYADNYSNHKLGLKDLLIVFEDCKMAMLELMQFSLTRFRNTAEFDKVEQIFATNHYI